MSRACTQPPPSDHRTPRAGPCRGRRNTGGGRRLELVGRATVKLPGSRRTALQGPSQWAWDTREVQGETWPPTSKGEGSSGEKVSIHHCSTAVTVRDDFEALILRELPGPGTEKKRCLSGLLLCLFIDSQVYETLELLGRGQPVSSPPKN